MTKTLTLCLGVVVGVCACGDTTVTVQPKGFTRGDAVAYMCIDRSTGATADRSACEGNDSYALLALVTQRDRGEVASVDLSAEVLIDTNRVIPGHTFAAVGDLPSGIAVADVAPKRIYVSNAGSFDVVAIEPKRVVFRDNDTAVPTERVSFEVAPSSVSITPDGSRLFVSLPDAGQIAVIDLEEDGAFGTVSNITLAPPALDVLEARSEATTWCFSCPAEQCARFDAEQQGLSLVPTVAGSSPRPGRALVDAATGSLLVTDAALPFLHRVDMSSLSVESLPTVAPLRALTLTDPLPTAIGASAEQQYLYAVSAQSEDILVMRYPSLEPILVGSENRGDPLHLQLDAPVVDLAYFRQTPETACVPGENEAGPLRLSGAFVGAITSDGRLHVIDLYDDDAAMGCRDDCEPSGDGFEVASYVRRHRRRIGNRIRQPISLASVPVYSIGALNIRPDDEGVSPSSAAPVLGQLNCPDDMVQVFPDPTEPEAGPARVCALANPWESQSARWRAFYEGTIAGTLGGDPIVDVVDGSVVITTKQNLCDAGVLGSEQAAEAGEGAPEAAYGGDALYVREELRLPQLDDADCAETFGENGSEAYRSFPIVRASAHALVLGEGEIAFSELQRCLGERPSFEVRARDAFVVGSPSRVPQHRVHEDIGGACVVDTSLPSRLQFRALIGQPFDNGDVAFNLQPASEAGESRLGPDTEVVLSFTVDDAPLPMQFSDMAILPTQLSHVPETQRLYVIDSQSRNYRYLRLDTLTKGQAFP